MLHGVIKNVEVDRFKKDLNIEKLSKINSIDNIIVNKDVYNFGIQTIKTNIHINPLIIKREGIYDKDFIINTKPLKVIDGLLLMKTNIQNKIYDIVKYKSNFNIIKYIK